MENGKAIGLFAPLRASGARGAAYSCSRRATVIFATGGLGALYAVTTNPLEARGEGLGMAARAGALIADPEFVQFHPTAIDIGRDPAPLATEALRGEGAVLINDRGRTDHSATSMPTPNWRRAISWRAPSIARSRSGHKSLPGLPRRHW